MIQCKDCEFYDRTPDGAAILRCDPFSSIKEPECLHKWQLIKLNAMVQAHQSVAAMHRRLAPLQEKMIKYMEREMEDIDEADAWKYGLDDEEDEDDEQNT